MRNRASSSLRGHRPPSASRRTPTGIEPESLRELPEGTLTSAPSSTRNRLSASARPVQTEALPGVRRVSAVFPAVGPPEASHPCSSAALSISSSKSFSCCFFAAFFTATDTGTPDLAKRVPAHSPNGQEPRFLSLYLNHARQVLERRAKPLSDLPCASNSSAKPRPFSFLFRGPFIVIVAFVLCVHALCGSSAIRAGWPRERPQPHGRQPSVRFQSGCLWIAKDHGQGLFETAAQTCSRYSFSVTTSPLVFSTFEYP